MQHTEPERGVSLSPDSQANDYHRLPATEKQLQYARHLSNMTGADLPTQVEADRRALSDWIDAQKNAQPANRFASYPSSKQVAFAERIARVKRRTVPPECFRDRGIMSKWIDGNR